MKSLIYILTAVSLGLYFLFSGEEYNFELNLLCLVIYIFSVIWLNVIKKKDNYFDFENIFLVSCGFIYFVYPCFVYPINPKMFFMFDFAFNEQKITEGTILSLLGLEFFILGSILPIKKTENDFSVEEIKLQPLKKLKYLIFFLFVLFYITAYRYFLDGIYYAPMPALAMYVYLLLQCAITVFLLLDLKNYFIAKKKKVKYRVSFFILILLFIVILTYVLIGYRSQAIYYMSIILFLYGIYIKRINLKKFIVLISLGAVFMTFIAYMRAGDVKENTDFRGNNVILGATMDLIINARTLYVALDYVDKNDVTYGKTMLVPLTSFIPFSQRIYQETGLLSKKEFTSGLFFTNLDFGEDSRFGVGSNIIADVYLAFGIVGVVVFMLALGYWQSKSYYSLYSNRVNKPLCYIVLMGLCLYMSRGEYFYSLKYIFWSILLFNIFVKKRKNGVTGK